MRGLVHFWAPATVPARIHPQPCHAAAGSQAREPRASECTMSPRRVVVTGLRIVSPVGNTLATAWDSIVNGRSDVGQITHFDASAYNSRIAAEVRDFDAKAWMPPKDVKKMETFIHYGLAASLMAMED